MQVGVTAKDVLAATAGVAGAIATDRAASTRGRRERVVALGLGLAGAAAVYPLARTGLSDRRAAAGEVVALASYGAAGVLAARRAGTDGHLIAGAGWLLHAVFDLVQGEGEESRLPGWYPALCAGFDVAVAGLLAGRQAMLDG
jgi:hypothetical protein